MRIDGQFFCLYKYFYLVLLVVLPACAESNPSLSEIGASASSVSNDISEHDEPNVKKIILEGTYEFRSDQDSLEIRGKQICFFPNENSSKQIPRDSDDAKLLWFCFSNTEQAAFILNVSLNDSTNCGVEGTAKIVVVDYEIYEGEGEGNDVAKLIEILEQSSTRPILCERNSISHDLKFQSDFEQMLDGFPKCEFNVPFFEEGTYRPLNKYLFKRNLMPSEIDSGLSAIYHINEIFHGVNVSVIPTTKGRQFTNLQM